MRITFRLNGQDVTVNVAPAKRLLHILKDDFDLVSLKGSCFHGRCGLCLVLIDGELVPSCMVPAFSAVKKSIVTLEGFRETEDFSDIERGFIQAGTAPCPSCASAKILATHVLLSEEPNPQEASIRKAFSGILCRCTAPSSLFEGIKSASANRRLRSHGRKV